MASEIIANTEEWKAWFYPETGPKYYPDQYFVLGPLHGQKFTFSSYGDVQTIYVAKSDPSTFNWLDDISPQTIFLQVAYVRVQFYFDGTIFRYWVPNEHREDKSTFVQLAKLIMEKHAV